LFSIDEVTELREGGDVRGRPLTAIMILELLQDAYIFSICITPMRMEFKSVSDMLFSGSSCQSRRAGVLCSVPETMRDMCGNHARQLIVIASKRTLLPYP
jgi:hypothetical protein